MQKLLRVAVIGVGKLGARHAQVYSKLAGIELVGVCDVDECRAAEVAKECDARAFKNHRELVGLVDAASIVVPSSQHYPISKDFLEKGVHVLIEKPITTSLDEADKLIALADKHGALIQVGHIERYNPGFRAIQHKIDRPQFIDCHRLGPYDPRIGDTGVTLDLMIHDIDIVLELVKSKVVSVDAVGARVITKSDDIANARIRFESGAVCDLTASRVTKDKARKILIFQDNAYLSLDYVTHEALLFTRENGGGIVEQKIDIQKSDALLDELADFAQSIRLKRKPAVSGREAREALALALEITRLIHEGLSR